MQYYYKINESLFCIRSDGKLFLFSKDKWKEIDYDKQPKSHAKDKEFQALIKRAIHIGEVVQCADQCFDERDNILLGINPLKPTHYDHDIALKYLQQNSIPLAPQEKATPTGFVRSFDIEKISKLTGENAKLYEKLKSDILARKLNEKVFPAVRKGEIHFYYKGGCLYKFNGSRFVRNEAYANYSANTEGLTPYEKAKKQCENRYSNAKGEAKERQLLDKLNSHTFAKNRKTKVVVLDIEVRLNGQKGGGKKCDMVLLNTTTNQLMFVEGKVFFDKRVNVKKVFIPEVISQVLTYKSAIQEQHQNIIEQYSKHIEIINKLFDMKYSSEVSLIDDAKLLIYNTPKTLNENGQSSINLINQAIKPENVAWIKIGEEPTIDEIWDMLCK